LWIGAVPELRHLRAFVVVAQERNFTRAAERLHLAQQAVSKTIAQLEAELGVALLERTTREVRLTAAGERLLAEAPGVLDAADAAFASAVEVGRGIAGVARVGVTPAVGAAAVQSAIGALRDGAPDLSVAIRDVRPGEIARLLGGRDLDAILARTAPAGATDVDHAALGATQACLAVPVGHRLARTGGPVDLADADGERLLVWSAPGTPYTDLLLERFAAAGATVVPVESRVTGAGALADLPSTDGALALVAEGAAVGPGVVLVPVAGDVCLPLLVLWARGTVPAVVQRLRDAVAPDTVAP